MRLFLAIELPDDVRRHLGGWTMQELSRLGFDVEGRAVEGRLSIPPPDNLHVTLKFLGDVNESAVRGLCEALGTVQFDAAAPVRVGHAELLPPRGPVRVIAAGLDGDAGRLAQLHRALEDACADEGFAPERRAYLPHITLARARDSLPAGARPKLIQKLGSLPQPEFQICGFTLFESRLGHGPPKYIPLAHFGG